MSFTVKDLREIRAQAAYQFELESLRLGFTVVSHLTNFRYVVRDGQTGTQHTAIVVPYSFDFYTFHLHQGKQHVDMLIVQRHNAVVPVRVLSLENVTSYAPLDVPLIERQTRKRRNHEEMCLLVSKLLLNFESAHEELARMPERTRQRYLHRAQCYLKPRIGRPWAS
ncbi:MAG TPA: hypothetical protein VKV40_08050 [Ktedonobacteraceae bacterium]|nr:hypothetical protein [Ktedonobacteraceae bacterium]